MSAPFQAYLNPSVGQYGLPSSTAFGSGDYNPNPSPVSTSASNPLGWANMNTAAPWTTPNGVTGQNPFSGSGSWGSVGMNGLGVGNDFNWMNGGGSFFGLGKKYNLPDITSPSYQGTLFNPDTGPYAQNYGNFNMSPEGQASSYQSPVQSANAMANGQQSAMNTNVQSNAQGNFDGPQYAGQSGLSSSQSYLGQSPYGLAGGTYVPGQGQSSASYGGYGNYGGYASSGSGMSPYVPGQ